MLKAVKSFILIALLASSALAGDRFEILKSSLLATRLRQISSEFILLQVWSPICVPCQQEVAEFNHLVEVVRRSGARSKLSVLGIPAHTKKKDALAFIEHFRPNYDQLWPDTALTAFFSNERQVPWTLLLDKHRKVVREWTGQLTTEQVMAELKRQPDSQN